MRPLSTELGWVYISGDGKKFLSEKEAKKHQRELEFEEIKEQLENKINKSRLEVEKLQKELEDVGIKDKSK